MEGDMKRLLAGCLVTMLCFGAGAGTSAAQSGAKDEAKKAGEATKEAGKEAGDAAKHAGKATVKGAKKGAKVVKNAVTGDAVAICKDGTTQTGRTKATACDDHGGVKD
jgi:hypothetical protein